MQEDVYACPLCQAKILRKCQAIHNAACQKKNNGIKTSASKMKKEEIQDLIPCTQCGESISFYMYEAHLNECEGRQLTKCQKCKLKFPSFLFDEHLQVCEGHPLIENEPQLYEIEQEEQNNPLYALIAQMAQKAIQNDDPLTMKEISQLKREVVTVQEECAICYCPIASKSSIIALKCRHHYHGACLEAWLAKNPKCPMCRKHA